MASFKLFTNVSAAVRSVVNVENHNYINSLQKMHEYIQIVALLTLQTTVNNQT